MRTAIGQKSHFEIHTSHLFEQMKFDPRSVAWDYFVLISSTRKRWETSIQFVNAALLLLLLLRAERFRGTNSVSRGDECAGDEEIHVAEDGHIDQIDY